MKSPRRRLKLPIGPPALHPLSRLKRDEEFFVTGVRRNQIATTLALIGEYNGAGFLVVKKPGGYRVLRLC